MKLQDAFVVESGLYVGNWAKIGYTMQASNNFTYDESGAPTYDAKGTVAIPTEAKAGWTATSKVKLNECAISGTWAITMIKSDDGNNPVTYGAKISSSDCYLLTPSLDQLTRGNVTTGS